MEKPIVSRLRAFRCDLTTQTPQIFVFSPDLFSFVHLPRPLPRVNQGALLTPLISEVKRFRIVPSSVFFTALGRRKERRKEREKRKNGAAFLAAFLAANNDQFLAPFEHPFPTQKHLGRLLCNIFSPHLLLPYYLRGIEERKKRRERTCLERFNKENKTKLLKKLSLSLSRQVSGQFSPSLFLNEQNDGENNDGDVEEEEKAPISISHLDIPFFAPVFLRELHLLKLHLGRGSRGRGHRPAVQHHSATVGR